MRNKTSLILLLLFVCLFVQKAHASVFASVQGVVHEPSHRPIASAHITFKATNSDFVLHATTGPDGSFLMEQAPIGVYTLTADATGFAPTSESVELASGTHS